MITLAIHVEESHGSRVVLESGALQKSRHYLGHLGEHRKTALITDARVSALYLKPVMNALAIPASGLLVLEVAEGENSKSFSTLNELAGSLAQKRFGRGDLIIALGGGVILDLAGFLASIYMRGIRYISIPTTLLAQADVCVGGKVAVNHAGGRNLLGNFHHPEMVLVDPNFLKSLDERDLKSGLAEVVKAGIIGDETLFQLCETRLDDVLRHTMDQWDEIITRALRVKKRIIEKDEKEKDLRMTLNLGHTLGHALEAATHFRLLRHGEAVALGMHAAALIARHRGLLSPRGLGRIRSVISTLLPDNAWKTTPNTTILDAMKLDKKKRFDRVPFILPKQVGEVATIWDVDRTEIAAALDEVKKHGPQDI